MKQNKSFKKKAMQKKKKFRWWLVPIGLLALILVAVISLLAWLQITEYYPRKNESNPVQGTATKVLTPETPVEILTWNIGYAGLSASEDFFMDGGTKSKPDSADVVNTNLASISNVLAEVDPDFVLLQEVDQNSTRSYHVNQVAALTNTANSFLHGREVSYSYALNYKCAFVPIPLPPMGQVESGLLTLSTYAIDHAARLPLPVSYDWPVRLAQLKRCLLITRIPIEGTSSQLVLVNLHLEAYAPEEAKQAQTKVLVDFLRAEYAKGNYCIAGGDWNQTFPGVDPSLYPLVDSSYYVAEELPADMLPASWNYYFDESTPTCRLLNKPFDPAAEDNQFYVIDGFMVSPNVVVNGVETLDLNFQSADHNPVLLTISFRDTNKYERSRIFEEDWMGYSVPGTITGDSDSTELWVRDYVTGALNVPEENLLSCTFDDYILTPAGYLADGYYGGATAWTVVYLNAAGQEETHTIQVVDFETFGYSSVAGHTTTRTLSGILMDDAVIEYRRDIYAYLEQDPRFTDKILGFDPLDVPANAVVTDFPGHLFPGEYLQGTFHLNQADDNLYAVVKSDSDGFLTNLVYCYFYRKDLGRVESTAILEGHFYGAYVDGETMLIDLEEGLYRVYPDGTQQLLETDGDLILSASKALVNRDGDIYLLDRLQNKETLLLDASEEGDDAIVHYQVHGALGETRFAFSASGWNGPMGCGVYDLESGTISWVKDATGAVLPVRAVALYDTLLFVAEEETDMLSAPMVVDLNTMTLQALKANIPDGAENFYFQEVGPDGKTVLFTGWSEETLQLRVFDVATGNVLLSYEFSNKAAAFQSITYTHEDTIGLLYRSYPSDVLQLLELPFGQDL